ncbi:hypothetical protein F4782DRAFT_416441 [Xylaria castorea]|nr:hypothetical protein F4782DRAFT_416441 [Xylaria castorea]
MDKLPGATGTLRLASPNFSRSLGTTASSYPWVRHLPCLQSSVTSSIFIDHYHFVSHQIWIGFAKSCRYSSQRLSLLFLVTKTFLTYEFLTGEAPFEDGVAMTQRRIVKGAMKPLPSRLSSEAKDFVHSLLVLDPSKRLPLKDVLNHPWIAKNCNLSR